MSQNPVAAAVRHVQECFDRATACLTEDDAGFAPAKGMYTAAQQVAHVAQTVEWFVAGAFSPKGFDVDFAAHDAAVRKVATLADARTWLARAFEAAIGRLGATSPADLAAPIAPGPVLGGAPRSAIVAGITDHTAHHRGALAVYARLRGKVPAMPYA